MQRAVNPQTGEVLFLVNNQWTPPSQTAKNPKTGQSAYLVNNEWQILDPFQKPKEEKGFFDKVADTFTPEPGGVVDRFLEAAKPEPFTREVLDVPLKFAEGVVTTSRAATEAFGANNELAQNIRGVEKYLASLASAQSKQDSAEIGRIMKEAEDKGVGEQLRSALKAFAVAPIDFLSQAAGSTVPVLLGAIAGAPGVVTTAGLVGAGVVKGTIYDTVKEELEQAGVPEKEAEARAQLAQEYGGENLDMILGGTALSVIAGRTGVEKYILGKIAAKEVAKDVAEKGVTRQALETGVTEAVPEALQAGQEQLAANIALQREGFDVPTFRGVAGQAALESIAGGVLGAGVGAAGAARPALPIDPLIQPITPETPTLTAPITPTPVLEQEGAIAPEVVPPESIAPAPQIAPVSQPTPIQIYNNPLDEVTAEVIANPDNRFSVRMTDLTTGQTMDGGTFDTADEANARAAQSIGMSIKPIAPVGPVQAPPAATPPTVAPPTVTPPEAAVTPPASAPISQEPVIPTSGFRTEKGSIYSLDEQGRTSRTKVSEGKGKGTTYDPHAALYVTPEDAQSILSDMQSGSIDQSASVRLGYIDLENNVFKTITDTSQLPAGVEPLVGVVDKNKNQLIGSYKAQLTPAVGLSPVEKMYTPDGMSNTHIGNKIVELFGQATPAATPAVEPTVTPETPPEAPPVSTRTAQEVQVDVNRTRQQIRQAKTAVKKGTVGPEFVSPLEAKLEALENELSQVKAAPRKAAPKYRDSKGNTWTGRGLQPAWLKEALGEGREIDEFAILPQLDNKSQDELVGRSEFPLIVPDARRAEIEQEIEDSLKKIRSLERPTGQDNLFTMLRGKFPKGYFKKNKIDISESLRNRLESDTGRSTLDSVVETGNLDRFFPEDSRIGNLASQRAEGTSRDLSRELDVVKDNVETLINKLESNDPLSEDTNLLMIELDLRIQELEKELQLEDVNQELSEVAIEERRIAQQIEADAIAEQEGTAASFEGQVREPEQPDFELRGQTQKELTDLERKDKTGEAERLRKERETREMVDRERDAFTLQPTTQPPLAKPAAPTGDLFGAKPTREEQAAINRARQGGAAQTNCCE
jgi:DNA-binding protein H-NS